MSDDAMETTVRASLRVHAYALLSAAIAAEEADADVAVAPEAARQIASVLLVAAVLVDEDDRPAAIPL
jgi:hypothetical protein